MAVNKVVYGGTTIIDISDSTVTPDKVLAGVIAYGASGERFEGTATTSYAKARRVDLTLPTSGWIQSEQWALKEITDSDGSSVYDSYDTVVEGAIFDDDIAVSNGNKYMQRVAANVKGNEYPFVQCILSENYETACKEIDQFNFITSIETFDGYIVATFRNNNSLSGPPDIDFNISLFIFDGVTEASTAAIHCAHARTTVVNLSASKWVQDGHMYTQSVPVDLADNEMFFADGLFSTNLETAFVEMQQIGYITDFVVTNGSMAAMCHNTDGAGPPVVDLQLSLKVFEIKE